MFIYFFVGKSYAVELEDGSEVAPSSQLTYFLKVTYDGVDKDGIESSGSASSQVKSDYIYVTDKLPDGLEFASFSTTHDGSIGAVQRGGHVSCDGKVVDDTKESSNTGEWDNSNTEFYYHGLHYNKNTRIISFTVENLKAGCELSVGIETMTPASVDDPNTTVVEGDYVDLFLSSDAMIHDSGSFIAEYLYLNKPVMRTLNGIDLKTLHNEFGQRCLHNHYMAHNSDDIESFILNVIHSFDPMKEQRTKFVNEVLMPKGSPSQNIINDILDSIDNQILYRN